MNGSMPALLLPPAVVILGLVGVAVYRQGLEFLNLGLGDVLGAAAVTYGFYLVSRVLHQEQQKDAIQRRLILERLDEFEILSGTVVDVLREAKGRRLDTNKDEDRRPIVFCRRCAHKIEDLREIAEKNGGLKHLSDKVNKVDKLFQDFREYVTGDHLSETVSPAFVVDVERRHRELQRAVLELQLEMA